METITRIRRAYFIQGKGIRLICREIHGSRKIVRKVPRSEVTEWRYERNQHGASVQSAGRRVRTGLIRARSHESFLIDDAGTRKGPL